MKNLKETMNEALVNEARQIEYRVAFVGCMDREYNPISVSILVDKEDQKWFELFLREEQDNIFSHAGGGNVEY
jgi:hypothetical protein